MNENQRLPDSLESTEIAPTETAPSSEAGEHIGPYKLLQKLGEGGMGEVWEAEQTEPVKRRVALKLIKRGMDTERVIARFEAERQALAMMEHPNVAKVLDAGSTPQGRPYFVMEYVRGVPITEHCDRHKLTNRDRLELFRQVCEGVQHAHQRAILHRDLKPSNVLVSLQDGKAVPKIIDFGVAKAISQKLTERTLFTEMGQLVGTPEYMSPEQAEMTGQNVDTRTDVYSLGVMIYELLVGALPFDPQELRQAGFQGLVHKIRDEEPPKPSTRLSTLGEQSTESARCRRVDLPTLQRQLRGDLDWITMKALEKDRTRRYGSPQELAADIERHLRDRPVLAGPPSTAYRAKKFVRRHKVGVGVAVAGLAVLIAFAGTMAYQAHRIARERDRANREAQSSERVAEFLADMLGNVDPEVLGSALWKDLRERVSESQRNRQANEETIEAMLASYEEAMAGVNSTDAALRLIDQQILSRAGETIEQKLAEDPLIAGRLERTLARTYGKLGLYEPAEQHARRAVELREASLGPEHPDALSAKAGLGWVYNRQGRYAEAEALHRETLEIRRRVLGEEHPVTLGSMSNLATSYFNMVGRAAEAEELSRETLELRRRVLGEEHPDTLDSVNNLANSYSGRRDYASAEALHRETLEIRRRVLGEEHQSTLDSMNNLARTYWRQRKVAEAEALDRQTLEIRRRVLGEEHPATVDSMIWVGQALAVQDRYTEAEAFFRRALELERRALGQDHPSTLNCMNSLANAYKGQDRYAEAEVLHRETLQIERRVLGEGHPLTNASIFNLAKIYSEQGREAELEAFHRDTLETRRRVLGEDHSYTLGSMHSLASFYKAAGDLDRARPLVADILAAFKKAAEEPSASPRAKNRYAWELLTCEPADLRDPDSALHFALEANELADSQEPAVLDTLSLAYHLTGDTAKAVENQKKAISLLPEGDSRQRKGLEEALAKFEAALQAKE